jgi:GGDEF domain-containing protein/CHASE3 domain sensor protein
MKLNRAWPFILDLLTPNRLLRGLNISAKVVLGYRILTVFTILTVVYALISLQRINKLNRDLLGVDVPVQANAGSMIDSLAAQEVYEKRFLILRRKDTRYLFWGRAKEFQTGLDALKKVPGANFDRLKKLEQLHNQCGDIFLRELKFIQQGKLRQAKSLSNRELKTRFDDIIEILQAMSAEARTGQGEKMARMNRIGRTAVVNTVFLLAASLFVGAMVAFILTRHISVSLARLNAATERIAGGEFDYDPEVRTADEIGDLAKAFLEMGNRLRKMEEMYLDASPLTRLPGGLAIEGDVSKRLASGLGMAFCVMDIDNFKAYNDRYGYAKGNVVIKETGLIIEKAAQGKGTAGDFIGHIGGDDFVLVTTPEHMNAVSAEIIREFDAHAPGFYDGEDRELGYILGKTRQGVAMRFPIMTISIAIVTNRTRTFANALEVSEVAAELKEYAKTIPRSVYVVDQRRTG